MRRGYNVQILTSVDLSLGKACPGVGTNGSELPSRNSVVLMSALSTSLSGLTGHTKVDDVYYKERSSFVSLRDSVPAPRDA